MLIKNKSLTDAIIEVCFFYEVVRTQLS